MGHYHLPRDRVRSSPIAGPVRLDQLEDVSESTAGVPGSGSARRELFWDECLISDRIGLDPPARCLNGPVLLNKFLDWVIQ